MQAWWEFAAQEIVLFPAVGIVILFALLACMHPLIEFPAGIISLTILATYWNNVWLAFLFLYGWHLVGLALLYLMLKKLTPFTHMIHRRFPLTKNAITWIGKQPPWKHILVIGMPLTYTYPLRIGWTIHHYSFQRYMLQASCIYAFFYVGNFLLYIGFMQWVEGIIPLWLLLGSLFCLSILIYAIKPHYFKRLVD